MAGGGNSGNSTTTQEVPGWLKDAYQANVSRATGIADKPFEAYTMPTRGADNSFYTDSRSTVQQAQGAGLGQVAGASKIFGEVADQSPNLLSAQQVGDVIDVRPELIRNSNLSSYMDPYNQKVVDATLGDIDLQRRRSLNEGNASTPTGAFGGSRQGVSDALTNEAFGRQAAMASAQLRDQNYQTALGSLNSDIGRQTQADTQNANLDYQARYNDANLRKDTDQFNIGADERNTALNIQGAQGLLGAGQAEQGLKLTQAQALMGAGDQIKQAQDAIYGDRYQDFERAQSDPFQKQQLLNQSVLGINAGGTTTSNSKGKGFSL